MTPVRCSYTDVFKLIAQFMDLRKMSDEAAQALIKQIYNVLDNEKEREQIQYAPNFLHVLRKPNCALTEGLDQKVEEYFPNYYKIFFLPFHRQYHLYYLCFLLRLTRLF